MKPTTIEIGETVVTIVPIKSGGRWWYVAKRGDNNVGTFDRRPTADTLARLINPAATQPDTTSDGDDSAWLMT